MLRMMIINITHTTIDTERNIIAHMNDGKGQAEPIRAGFDAANANLTPDQNQAIETVLTSPDKVIGIQAYAGTSANPAHALLLFDDIFFGISIGFWASLLLEW